MENQNYKEYLVFRDIEYSKNDYDSMFRLCVCLNWSYPMKSLYFTVREDDKEVIILLKSDQGTTFKTLHTLEEIVDYISDYSICYIKRVVNNQIVQIYKNGEWYNHHDGTGDLHGKLTIPETSMHMKIDNYHISAVNNYMSICIDGQNIIHQKLKQNDTQSRARLAHVAIEAINGYNYTHDLEWNTLRKEI